MRITDEGAVGLAVAGVRNQLRIPHAIVVQTVGALRKYGDGRSAGVAWWRGVVVAVTVGVESDTQKRQLREVLMVLHVIGIAACIALITRLRTGVN